MVSFSVRGFFKYWFPVVAWMILVFLASGDLMSSEHTSRFIGPFLRWLFPDVSGATIASVQFVVRKAAHLTVYAVLAILLYRAFRQDSNRLWRAALPSLFIAGLYATLDEFHQSFVSTRTGTPRDVFIDCIGAAIGLALFHVFSRRGNQEAPIEIRK